MGSSHEDDRICGSLSGHSLIRRVPHVILSSSAAAPPQTEPADPDRPISAEPEPPAEPGTPGTEPVLHRSEPHRTEPPQPEPERPLRVQMKEIYTTDEPVLTE